MEEKKLIHCTLTDRELAAKADQWIDELIASGGKSFTMQIPARPNADTDLIFAELNNRFKKLITDKHSCAAWVKAFCEEIQTSINRIKAKRDKVTCLENIYHGYDLDGRELAALTGILIKLEKHIDESPAAAREEDAKPFKGLKFRSRVAPINSYEVVEVFEQSNEFKVKVTQECEVNRTTCYEVWSIDGFVKYYNMGVYFKQQKEK